MEEVVQVPRITPHEKITQCQVVQGTWIRFFIQGKVIQLFIEQIVEEVVQVLKMIPQEKVTQRQTAGSYEVRG